MFRYNSSVLQDADVSFVSMYSYIRVTITFRSFINSTIIIMFNDCLCDRAFINDGITNGFV